MVVVNIAHHVLTDQIKIIKTQSPVATWHQWQKGLFLSLNKCTKVFNCFNWPRSYFRRFPPDFTKNVFVTFLPMELTGHYQTMLLVQPTHVTMRFGSTLEAGLRSSPLIPGEFKITQRCLNRDACWLKSVHDDMNGNMYLAVTFIHSQTAAYTVHFIAVASTATPFASPSSPIHSLVSTSTHARSLSLAHSHLTVRPIPKRIYAALTTMATADAGDPWTELEPPPLSLKSQVWKYFGCPVRYVDKKATVTYCYIMLLINVLKLTM